MLGFILLIVLVDFSLFPVEFLFIEFKAARREIRSIERIPHQMKQGIDKLILDLFVFQERHELLTSNGLTIIIERQKHLIDGILMNIRECSQRKHIALEIKVFCLVLANRFVVTTQRVSWKGSVDVGNVLIVLINGVNNVSDGVRRRTSYKVKCIHNLLSLPHLFSSCFIQLGESNRVHE